MDWIYLDHAATTPTDPRVVAAMLPYLTEVFAKTNLSELSSLTLAVQLFAHMMRQSPDGKQIVGLEKRHTVLGIEPLSRQNLVGNGLEFRIFQT